MSNMNVLTGVVMLETIWETRHKDLLDLITPFIKYSVAKTTSPGDKIDLNAVLELVKSNFGYTDMPKSVVERILKRNSNQFIKRNGDYILKSSLDEEIETIEKKRTECETHINLVGEKLADYLESHCKVRKKYTLEEVTNDLQMFFSRYGLYVGTNDPHFHNIDYKSNEKDYYIAKFILEKQQEKSVEYKYILDLVKGYFLQSAIYLQAENGNVTKANYSRVTFYYDTPFLLNLLGYTGLERQQCAEELHKLLIDQKGVFKYFPRTKEEIYNILVAFQHSQKTLNNSNRFNLSGLDGYSYDSLERVKSLWSGRLDVSYNVQLLNDLPAYVTNENGSIDIRNVLDEKGIIEYFNENGYKPNNDKTLESDIELILAIHRLRGDTVDSKLEHCKAIFVTSNKTLAYLFNKYYSENVNNIEFPLVITDADLAAITWVRSASFSNLPEKQLLQNAYMATQPTPELMDKFALLLDRMKNEGKISDDVAIILKSDRFVQKEVLVASFDDENALSETFVENAEKRLKETLISDEVEKNKLRQKKDYSENITKVENEALQKAKNKGAFYRKAMKFCFYMVVLFLFVLITYSVIQFSAIQFTLFYVIYIGFTAFSVFDVLLSRKYLFDKIIEKKCNRIETKYYEKKKLEYTQLINKPKDF